MFTYLISFGKCVKAPDQSSATKRAPLRRGIGPAVLMHEPPVGIGTHHVDIGASSEVVRVPRAHLEIDGHSSGSVNQVMAVACAFRKRSAIARVQYGLATIFDEHQLAFKQRYELVFVAVPVALTGPAAGWQGHQIHAEIAKATRIAQAPPRTRSTGFIEW